VQLGRSSARSKTSGPMPADTWPADRCGQVSATYHGPCTTPRVGARERYHKLSDLVVHEVTYRDESHCLTIRLAWSRACDGVQELSQRIVASASGPRHCDTVHAATLAGVGPPPPRPPTRDRRAGRGAELDGGGARRAGAAPRPATDG